MKESLRKHIFLFLSLICFSVSAILWFNYNTEDIPYRDQQEIKAIRKKILLHLDNVKTEAETVIKRIEKGKKVNFTSLQQAYDYPCYVYKNGKLLYWSDFRFVPSYEDLKTDTITRYLNLRTGKYISCRKAWRNGEDRWEVFSLLNLYHQYPIKNNYINSGLNKDIFGNVFLRISETSLGTDNEIRTREGQYLFSLDLSVHSSESSRQELLWFIIASFSLGILFLLIYMMGFFDELSRWLGTDWSLVMFIALLVLVRSIMLYFSFPYSLVEMELFNPRYYASSWVSPSLGDLLFNALFYLLITWSVYKNYYRLDSVRWLITIRKGARPAIISVIMIVLAYFALYSVYDQLYVIYHNSQWVIDISQSLEFDLFKISCLVIFVVICFCFFIWSHLFYRIFLELNPRLKSRQVYLLIIAFLLTIGISWLSESWNWIVYLCFLVYSMIILNFSLPNILSKLKYDSYLYFLSSSVICAVLGVSALYNHQESKNIINKEKFASQIFVDNDLYGEYLLKHASERIEQDEFFKNTLESPFASKQLIIQKIKKVYLPRYFDRYDLVINLFDAEGTPYVEENNFTFSNYANAVTAYKKPAYSTDYDKVYFIKGTRQNVAKSYVVLTDIVRDQDTLGHVLVQLKHKRIVPNNVFPELLVDRQFAQPADNNNSYNYAVYTTDYQLLYNFGPYNYDKKFDIKWMSDPRLYKEGLTDGEFHHLAVKSGDDKLVIVTSERFSFYRVFANFSFLFLILVLFIGCFLGYAVYFRFDQINFSYATRIQFYLNVAFFLPLIIVSITTLSIISSTYSDSLNKSFIETAEDLSLHLASFMEEQQKYSITQEKVEEELSEMAQYTHTDINIFDTKGMLSFTTQPAIYENNLLSTYINPLAYEAIVENRSSSVMLNESVGKLNYNCAYVAVRSYQSGRMLGVISIPFFESKVEMDRQIIGVMTTILNIFTATFLVILILSYIVSRLLTEPIRIIAQKIRRTTLGENEPIEWDSNDEIGMLVAEYNEMLVKLEQSRQALSKSEKESAWREMAKQVAHEIKNPLTPMKLAIQHLQKSIREKRDNAEQLTEKTLHTLLDQVNTLSEIATSFSAFAKMPIPKLEPYNITRSVSNTVNLYTNRTDLVVNSLIPDHEVMVMGDEQLMNGIITNLILNGIQSVPSSRMPEIEVRFTHDEQNVFIEVKDNGSGIPDSIRDKVFLPNFSTKYTGSGIGLAVAKRGVEHAGGRIWFETEEEQGTSFYIELPLLH